jgi:hypothetical protein
MAGKVPYTYLSVRRGTPWTLMQIDPTSPIPDHMTVIPDKKVVGFYRKGADGNPSGSRTRRESGERVSYAATKLDTNKEEHE